MALKVDVIVLSEAPKDLGPGVEVVVGLPSKNPWSLPFAHKPLFAQRVDQYDLFAYSEDDMEVTEGNIQAFLRVTPHLEDREIAGFLRYEEGESGDWSLPDVQAMYRWKPESVRRRGTHTFAEYTNEHAAFYILTQAQLRKAVASGGFLREPYEGRHDMLCAAATDPYTNCGFAKVICISSLEDSLIHHLSNRYVGQVGLALDSLKEQILTLMGIGDGTHPATTLCGTESKMRRLKWSKSYYEPSDEAVLEMVPPAAKCVLSVGCGWGATEAALKRMGTHVTALPLDSVIGAAAARLEITVVYGTFEECLSKLDGRQFECVFLSNLLHLAPDPWLMLQQCAAMVQPRGTFVILSPNFNSLPVLFRRTLSFGEGRDLRSFSRSGVNAYGVHSVARRLKGSGFHSFGVRWFSLPGLGAASPERRFAGMRRRFGRYMASDWVLRARR